MRSKKVPPKPPPRANPGRKGPPKKTGGLSAAIQTKLFGRPDAPQTVQQSIPYKEMHRDGICRVSDRFFTKTIAFGDTNYQLAQNEDKTQIFESYCSFLNFFDSTISVQLTFINRRANLREFQQSIDIPDRDDAFNGIRREYAGMLKNQLAKGNNGLVKSKYITFGIEAASLKEARPRLERIEADVLANFKVLGVTARSLNGLERLEILHGQFHPDGHEKFRFDWKDVPRSGNGSKDAISPSGFDFRDGRMFRMGAYYGTASFVQILAPELTDRMLADFLDLDDAVTVNLHIRSIDQGEAIKRIKHKISDIQKMVIEEQKKAVRAGYDTDIIPSDLATYGTEAKTLLEDLQSRNERMFLVTFLVLNTAEKKQRLENNAFAAAGIAQKYNCALKRLDWQQEQGLMSSLPLGVNQIEIQRGLTTSSTAIFVPIDLKGAKCTCPEISGGHGVCGTEGRAAEKFFFRCWNNALLPVTLRGVPEKYFLRTVKSGSEMSSVFFFTTEGQHPNTATGGNANRTREGGHGSKQRYPSDNNNLKGAKPMSTTLTSAAPTPREEAAGEPVKYLKRIGSTTFVVAIHFSRTSADTAREVSKRLIEREVSKIA